MIWRRGEVEMRAECEDMHAWCRGPEEVTAGSYVVTRFPSDCEGGGR